MNLSDIFSKSISYPFSDLKKFVIIGILAMLADIDSVFEAFNSSPGIIGTIIGLIFTILVAGYTINVIKNAIDGSSEIPGLDFANNFVDGIKVTIIAIIYFIIPIIITLILLVMFGAIGAGLDQIVGSLGIWAVLAIILFIVFAIFELIAEARFAVSRNIGDALNIGAVIEDIKRIGVSKVIGYVIILVILVLVVTVVVDLLDIIPYVGVIIASIILGGFTTLFSGYSLGLLYKE